MKQKQPTPVLTEPTRESVWHIFNELIPDRYRNDESYTEDHDYQQACEAVAVRERELEGDAKLVRLKKRVEDCRAAATKRRISITAAAKKVRLLHNAKGLTPDVKAELLKLVAMANKR